MAEELKPKVYTKEQVADLLQVSLRTVTTLVSEGVIPSLKVGHQRRIPEAALDEYIRTSTEGKAVKADKAVKEAKNAKR